MNYRFYKFIEGWAILPILLVAALCLTSCSFLIERSQSMVIEAMGGIEYDISDRPEFAHLFNREYELKRDVFVYRSNSDYTKKILHVKIPGAFSHLPISMEDYMLNRNKYDCFLGLISAGAKFTVSKIVESHSSGGLVHEVPYIEIQGYDFKGYRVDGFSLYNSFGKNAHTFDTQYVEPVRKGVKFTPSDEEIK